MIDIDNNFTKDKEENMRGDFDKLKIVDIALDESGYNYYGFVAPGEESRSVIIREKTDETEYRYFFGVALNYSSNWSNRATLNNYILPSELSGRD